MTTTTHLTAVNRTTGKRVNVGDKIRLSGGRIYTFGGATRPTVPGKSGKWIARTGETQTRELYAHIADLKVIPTKLESAVLPPRLSSTQKEILLDRLMLSECVIECLCTDYGASTDNHDEDTALYVIELLQAWLAGDSSCWVSAIVSHYEITRDVLIDCINGNTLYARTEGDPESGNLALANLGRAGRALVKKLAPVTVTSEQSIEFPTW
jgi:hypothetical protein